MNGPQVEGMAFERKAAPVVSFPVAPVSATVMPISIGTVNIGPVRQDIAVIRRPVVNMGFDGGQTLRGLIQGGLRFLFDCLDPALQFRFALGQPGLTLANIRIPSFAILPPLLFLNETAGGVIKGRLFRVQENLGMGGRVQIGDVA
jgi:hypothetical protein